MTVPLSAQPAEPGLSFAESLQRLERQPEHPQFAARLIQTARLAENPSLASEILSKHRERVRDPAQRAEVDLLLAGFAEFRSELSTAREHFRRAAEPDTPLKGSALAGLGALELELGNTDAALRSSRAAAELLASASDPDVQSWERSILTQTAVLQAQNRSAEALQLLQTAPEQYGMPLTPAVLLRSVELAAEQGQAETVEQAYSSLADTFPESPERRLAARYREAGSASVVGAGSVEYFPVPSRVLSGAGTLSAVPPAVGQDNRTGTTPSSTHPTESRPASTTERTVYGVQTGSFADPENAQYMVKDLEQAAFSARQRNRRVGETLYYQVYVPVEGSDPQQLLVRLKEQGFEGFLLFE